MKYVDPGTFSLYKSLIPVVVGAINCLFFHQPLSKTQILCLAIQMLGIIPVITTKGLEGSNSIAYGQRSLLVMVTIILYGSFNTVCNASLIKRESERVPVYVQNSVLYGTGVLVNIFLYFITNSPNHAFFFGYNNVGVILLLVFNSSAGVIISYVYKHGDAVLKTLAQPVSSSFLVLISYLFFDSTFDIVKASGSGVVIISSLLYLDLPKVDTKEKSITTSKSCHFVRVFATFILVLTFLSCFAVSKSDNIVSLLSSDKTKENRLTSSQPKTSHISSNEKQNRVAIGLRGKCSDEVVDAKKENVVYSIDYKKCLPSFFKNIIDNNPGYEFHFYLHGWINDVNSADQIKSDYGEPHAAILERQRNFSKYYSSLNNHSLILKERYKHLHKNRNASYYSDINYAGYFQNMFSYAYSISKVAELISNSGNEYDYVVFLRYDVCLSEKIFFDQLQKDVVYTDSVGKCHSPLFYGDFMYVSNKERAIQMKDFFFFLRESIFNNFTYATWVEHIIQNKASYTGDNAAARYSHGIYSNQMVYAYYLSKAVGIPFDSVESKFKCHLVKDMKKL